MRVYKLGILLKYKTLIMELVVLEGNDGKTKILSGLWTCGRSLEIVEITPHGRLNIWALRTVGSFGDTALYSHYNSMNQC